MEFPLSNYLQSVWSSHFWISLFIVIMIRMVVGLWWTRRNLPPGPTPYPLIGNLFMFRGPLAPHEVMLDLSKEYGDIMSLFIGSKPHVVVSKYDMAKTVLSSTVFSGRPDSPVARIFFENTENIVMGNFGLLWQLNRKTASKCMRVVLRRGELEESLIDTVDVTADHLIEQGIVNPDALVPLVYNAISLIAFGRTYKPDDPELLHLLGTQSKVNQAMRSLTVFDFLPFADYWPLKIFPNVRRGLDSFNQAKAYVEWQIYEHQRTLQTDRTRDLCDALLQEQQLLERQDDLQLTDQNMVLILMDLFGGGLDTVAAALSWFVLFMVTHPDLQERCYDAIKAVLGERPPKSADRNQLAIVGACIMETLRLRPPVPCGIPHATMASTQMGEHSLPEGTAIVTNIHAMHLDPDHWANPQSFDPQSHFIDENGRLKIAASFAPFGFGRRSCLGETLAYRDMFLVATRLLQTMRFEPVEGETYVLDPYGKGYVISKPVPYSVKVVARE